ncbi:MAG: hypothetical protein JXB46_03655 [Candidatus Eisenbacteria bacterium]|nr:hypothetical protein [Candidatus Eisenbacteria bacterium]
MKLAITAIAAALLFVATPAARAQECSEEVRLEPLDGTILMHHIEARFNCCACVYTEASLDGFEIDFLEREDFSCGACYCQCCFGIEASIGGLAAGDYTVRVWKLYDNGNGTWTEELIGTWLVAVAGQSEPSFWSSYVPCVNTAIPEDQNSWGIIKALYRRSGR